jgi:cell division protein FtsX
MDYRKEDKAVKKLWAVCIVVALLFALAGCGLLTKQAMLIVYISEDLSDAEARVVETRLNTIQDVVHTDFVSGKEAWESFAADHDDSAVLAGIEEIDLRNRIYVTAMSTDMEALMTEVWQIDGVAEVKVAHVKWKPFGT